MHELHVRGTSGLLSAVARLAPQARVLLFGSAAEYGRVPPEHLPITEQQPPRPVTAFGLSKLAQTELAAKFAQEHALRIVTIRPFNIVGAGLPEHFFAAALARRMLLHRATAAHGPVAVMNLEATRDFVDVRDAARAIAGLLSESSWRRGRMDIYNIASGSAVSLKEVAALLGRLAGGVGIENGGTAPSRSGIDRSCGDPARLYQAIRWTPRWSWQQSIIALWEELARTACCRGGAHELDPNSPQGEILAPQTGIARAG
jgi:GDP-4-dehydro-6-deoxy-D-mannose reductase